MAGTGGRRPGAGRPPGRLCNLAMAAKDLMQTKNYNPFEAMIDIVNDPNTPLDLRLQGHKELCKYHSPQLKSLDVNMAMKGSLAVRLVSFADEQEQIKQQQELYDKHQRELAEQEGINE